MIHVSFFKMRVVWWVGPSVSSTMGALLPGDITDVGGILPSFGSILYTMYTLCLLEAWWWYTQYSVVTPPK